jgi:hypothetical protein
MEAVAQMEMNYSAFFLNLSFERSMLTSLDRPCFKSYSLLV